MERKKKIISPNLVAQIPNNYLRMLETRVINQRIIGELARLSVGLLYRTTEIRNLGSEFCLTC